MKKLIKSVLMSPGLRQSIVLIGGTILASGISAIALILVSRKLGPTLFAEFTVGYSLLAILAKVQSLGLSVAMQKIAGKYFHHPEWENKLSTLLQVGTRINILIILGSTLIGLIIAVPFAKLLHFPSSTIILGSFLFASVTMLFDYVTTVLQIIHKFTQTVLLFFIQSISKFILTLAIIFTHFNSVTGLFYLFYGIPALAVCFSPKFLPPKVKIWPPKNDPEIQTQLWQVMRHSIILTATVGIIEYLDILFVQRYTTQFQTGLYGGLLELGNAITLVGFSLAAVLNARVARYHQITELNSFIKKGVGIFCLTIIGFILYLPFNHLSIQLTIGSQYLPGEAYLPWLMLSGFILIMSVPFAALFYSFDQPRYFSISGIGQILITIIGGFIFIPKYGINGAIWVKLTSRAFLLIFTLGFAYFAYQQKKRAAQLLSS